MIYNSSLWFDDIDEVSRVIPELDELAGKTVLITGAGGLICSAVADILIRYNESHDLPIGIIAAGRSEDRMRNRFGHFFDRKYFGFTEYDALSGSIPDMVSCDYIINGAGNAYPKAISGQPVETLMANVSGQRALLEYARDKGVRRILYISSSEIYGRISRLEPICEDNYGYIDPLDPRNSYSIGKQAAEALCRSYSDEYGVDSVIVRPGHIYGPTASRDDNRVSSMWAYDAAAGRDIVMKSDGASIRSYCYCPDCASAIIKVLLRGESGRAYNISNPSSIISIKEMAEILSDVSGVMLVKACPEESERKAFNPMTNSSLNSDLLTALGWRGVFDARKGLEHTVEILREL